MAQIDIYCAGVIFCYGMLLDIFSKENLIQVCISPKKIRETTILRLDHIVSSTEDPNL